MGIVCYCSISVHAVNFFGPSHALEINSPVVILLPVKDRARLGKAVIVGRDLVGVPFGCDQEPWP